MGSQLLSDIKFYSDYSRWQESEGRTESWEESVDRIMGMHRERYSEKFESSPELRKLVKFAEESYRDRDVLGSQRALQFGGDPILAHNSRLYNCVKESTRFITDEGVRSFEDFSDGDTITVLTHKGRWKPATVKSYGEQDLNKIVFRKGGTNITKDVYATSNHRWLLKNGEETTSLGVNDRVMTSPDIFSEFDFDSAGPVERIYWCYGMVFGDGTVNKAKNNSYSMIRLCGNDTRFETRFTDLGWKSSSPASIGGDVMVYTGKYLKTVPNPSVDSPALIRAFVAGYMQADGYKNRNSTCSNPSGKQYTGIQATDGKYINAIRELFPVAGVHILSERDKTGQVTNFGTRPYTVEFGTYEGCRSKFDKPWVVDTIIPHSREVVWCLEVEDDQSFVLEGGIVTGNCLGSYCDRVEFFQEAMYWLLSGCGIGFSVQYCHIEKLPTIRQREGGVKTFVVPDSIEGWADAFGVLISSYVTSGATFPEYQNYRVDFDFNQVRPKGAKISGGFKAPGPDGLRKSLIRCQELLDKVVAKGESEIRSIIAYDFIMHMSDAVLSGGLRRSASLCMFSPDDVEMMAAKTGDWFIDNPQRARSNNSAALVRSKVTKEQFTNLFKSVKAFGEPGFIFTEHEDIIYNPCVSY